MIGQGVWTNIFGLAEPGDTALVERIAVAAAKAGYAVVLDRPGEKAPMCTLTARKAKTEDTRVQRAAQAAGDRLWQRRRHACGLAHAMTDPAVVTRVVRRMAAAGIVPNLGLELGASRMVVVDVDTTEERDAFLTDWALEHTGGYLAPGMTVQSPGVMREGEWVHSGGGHFWFTLPDGVELPEGSGVLKADSGWSVMWAKHQVLVPPSRRPEGPYVLLAQPEVCPQWILDRITLAVEARRERATRSLDLVLDSGKPDEQWQAKTPWSDLLEVDGWTDTGLVDTCSCPIWTAPGAHASPKSATAHDVGCSRYDVTTGWGPLHVWTDNPPEFLAGGGNTFTKIQYLARRDHDGAFLPVFRELGLADTYRDEEFPGFQMGIGALDDVPLPGPMADERFVSQDPFSDATDPDDDPGEDVVDGEAELDPVSALLAEMLSSEELDGIPDPEPLVAGVLDLDTVARIVGKSNHGKTFVALDLAGSVATGQPWHGRETTQGLVVFLVAEGARGFKKRLRAWERRHNGGVPIERERLLVLPRPVQSADTKAWRVLVLALHQLRPRLVFLDTQARITVGVNENDNSEMGIFIERVEQIRRSTGACVCVVHHLGHNGDQGRGASAVVGAVNTEIRVTKPAEGVIHIHNDKQKDEAQFAPIELFLEPDGDSAVLVGADDTRDPFEAPEVGPESPAVDRMLKITHEVFPFNGGTKAEIKRTVLKHDAGRTGSPMAERTFLRAWDQAVSSGYMARVVDAQEKATGRWIVSTETVTRLALSNQTFCHVNVIRSSSTVDSDIGTTSTVEDDQEPDQAK